MGEGAGLSTQSVAALSSAGEPKPGDRIGGHANKYEGRTNRICPPAEGGQANKWFGGDLSPKMGGAHNFLIFVRKT